MTEPKRTRRAAAEEEAASRLRLAVLRLARRLRQESPPGITQSQMSALSVIAGLGPLTISELAAQENVQSPTISRIVDALETAGWVERVADGSDRRITRVRTTEKAEREIVRVRAERNAYLARRLAALDPAERDALLAAVPALERLLEEPE